MALNESGKQSHLVMSQGSAKETKKGLERLMWGLPLSTIGAFLGIFPYISDLGALIDFIGLVLLILGWWALGKSNLGGGRRFHNTAILLIITLIIFFVGTLIGELAIVFGAISSESANSGPVSLAINVATQTLELVALMSIFLFAGQLYSAFSLKKLSQSVSEPYIRKAGNFFIVALLISIAALIGVVVFIVDGAFHAFFQTLVSDAIANGTSPQVSTISLMFTEGFAYLGLFTFAGYAVLFLANYYMYEGAKRVISRIPQLDISAPEIQSQSSSVSRALGFCPYCGSKFPSDGIPKDLSGVSYCPYCKQKLPS